MKRTAIGLFMFAVLFTGGIFAQDVSISASPIRVEHLTKQGQKGTDVITLTNSGTKPVRLRVTVEEFTVDAKGTPAFTKPVGAPYSCAAWIQVNPMDFRVEPGQTREVRYSLAVPADIPDAGYRAAIVFQTVPDVRPGAAVKAVMIQGRIAVALYERVGQPAVDGRFKGLRTKIRPDGVDFLLDLSNGGRVYFRTKGTISVRDQAGQTVVELDIPDAPVLQGSDRVLEAPFKGALKKGTYSVRAALDIGMKDRLGLETSLTVPADIPKK